MGVRHGAAILGLSALAHDPAAALIVDGHLVAAVEEMCVSLIMSLS